MELAALEVRLRQGLDSVSAKRCMEVWRKALHMRLSEQSREAWAVQHHTHTAMRRALSTWRCAYQHTVAAEAEKVCELRVRKHVCVEVHLEAHVCNDLI